MFRALTVALLFIVLSPHQARGFRTHHTPADGPREVPYRLLAEDASKPSFVKLVHQAFSVWNDVPCSGLRFVYDGTVDKADHGKNLVFVPHTRAEYNKYCGHREASESAGCASGDTSSFNIVLRSSSLDVLIHEIGHVVGLGHAARGSSVMYYSGGPTGPWLSPDDERGLCYLFPAEPSPCKSDRDCPYKYGDKDGPTTCVDGRCEAGATGPGGECEEDRDCRSGKCFYTAGLFITGGGDHTWIEGVCAESCRTRDDCSDGQMCGYDRNEHALCVPGHQCFDDGNCLDVAREAICVATSRHRQTNRCATPCSSDDDCTEGECQPNQWMDVKVCTLPPSSSAGCSVVPALRPWWLLLLSVLLARRALDRPS